MCASQRATPAAVIRRQNANPGSLTPDSFHSLSKSEGSIVCVAGATWTMTAAATTTPGDMSRECTAKRQYLRVCVWAPDDGGDVRRCLGQKLGVAVQQLVAAEEVVGPGLVRDRCHPVLCHGQQQLPRGVQQGLVVLPTRTTGSSPLATFAPVALIPLAVQSCKTCLTGW